MKEIDFIPEWYRANQVRKRRYARQYAIMTVVFVGMMVWSLIVGRHVKSVSAEVQEIQTAFAKGSSRVQQTQQLKSEIAVMQQKTAILDKITSRTPITAVLGELSCWVRENIVLNKLSLTYEPITELKKEASASAIVVQLRDSKRRQDDVIPDTPLRLKVTLAGIAAKPADAAALITGLEEAEYFQEVALVFSRPKSIMDENVTEFEIRCYVADYYIEK